MSKQKTTGDKQISVLICLPRCATSSIGTEHIFHTWYFSSFFYKDSKITLPFLLKLERGTITPDLIKNTEVEYLGFKRISTKRKKMYAVFCINTYHKWTNNFEKLEFLYWLDTTVLIPRKRLNLLKYKLLIQITPTVTTNINI